MDAFYASVEVLDDPSLAGKPVIVGGTGGRGVVAACSYEARAYGVRSAMPSVRARRLCPHAVFLPGRFDRYIELSAQLHEIFLDFTPLVEGISLDEAFLDVAGARRLLGPAPEIAAAIRGRIADEMGLPASVGRGHLQADRQAGVGGGQADGVARRARCRGRACSWWSRARSWRSSTPTRCGRCGASARPPTRRLERFGVGTVGDLAALPVDTLVGALGPAPGRHLHELAWARDPRPVVPDRAVKSIGHEETFAHRPVRPATPRTSRSCASPTPWPPACARRGWPGARSPSRSASPTSAPSPGRGPRRRRSTPGPELARLAAELLAAVDCSPGVRLLGVSASNLVDPPGGAAELRRSPAPRAGGPASGRRAGAGGPGGRRGPAPVRRRRGGPGVAGPGRRR